MSEGVGLNIKHSNPIQSGTGDVLNELSNGGRQPINVQGPNTGGGINQKTLIIIGVASLAALWLIKRR